MPLITYYKPRGVPLAVLQRIALTVDELEAVRLADLEGMHQEQAAEKMNISRQTFGRIIESAHKKIADALVNGKALSIEGGPIELANGVPFQPPMGPAGGFYHRGRRGWRGGR
jgi:predicted DNA-binding protein (UPF0251 family)